MSFHSSNKDHDLTIVRNDDAETFTVRDHNDGAVTLAFDACDGNHVEVTFSEHADDLAAIRDALDDALQDRNLDYALQLIRVADSDVVQDHGKAIRTALQIIRVAQDNHDLEVSVDMDDYWGVGIEGVGARAFASDTLTAFTYGEDRTIVQMRLVEVNPDGIEVMRRMVRQYDADQAKLLKVSPAQERVLLYMRDYGSTGIIRKPSPIGGDEMPLSSLMALERKKLVVQDGPPKVALLDDSWSLTKQGMRIADALDKRTQPT